LRRHNAKDSTIQTIITVIVCDSQLARVEPRVLKGA